MRRLASLGFIIVLAACGNRGERAAADARPDSADVGVADPANAAAVVVGEVPAGDSIELAPVRGQLDGPRPAPASAGGSQAPQRAPVTALPVTSEPAGQGSDDGAAILRRAAAAYENVRSLRADFVMLYENALLRQKTTSRGALYQRRPDRIALRFTDPAGDLLVGDGQHFYWYTPSIDAQQVLCSPVSAAGGGGGIDLQAQFVGNPVERFQFTLHGTESVDGRPASVLTLVPRQNAEYRSLKVWLDTRDSLARRFEITEKNGTVRRFDLDDMVINPSIPDATFRFSPPPNARIVGC
ncbi:MAG TPA: outer membrane lipoprotein carrier protein LolA [Longimicrobiales bacterium]|nr:outer membrane lipoprotein carrier protein LolA [Longimicrobiales bacterium]